MDVEVGVEAGVVLSVNVRPVNDDLHLVVAERSERGNQPRDGIGVFVTSTVLSGMTRVEILSVKSDGRRRAFSGELHVDIVANDVGIVVENDIEVQADEVTDNGGVRFGSASGNVIQVKRLALGPAHSGCGGTDSASMQLHLHK